MKRGVKFNVDEAQGSCGIIYFDEVKQKQNKSRNAYIDRILNHKVVHHSHI